MALAVDSSTLYAMIKPEPSGERWFDLLMELGRHERLVVCDVVLAETAPFFDDCSAMMERFSALGLEFDPIQPETAFLAGEIFADYRRSGGPRASLIPDFLVGAHALHQADGIIADDRGYLRQYFKGLKVIPLPKS